MFNRQKVRDLEQSRDDYKDAYTACVDRAYRLEQQVDKRLSELIDLQDLCDRRCKEHEAVLAELGSANNRLALIRHDRDDLRITIKHQAELREAVEQKLNDALVVTAQLRLDNEELRFRNAALVDIATRANERLNHFFLGVAVGTTKQ